MFWRLECFKWDILVLPVLSSLIFKVIFVLAAPPIGFHECESSRISSIPVSIIPRTVHVQQEEAVAATTPGTMTEWSYVPRRMGSLPPPPAPVREMSAEGGERVVRVVWGDPDAWYNTTEAVQYMDLYYLTFTMIRNTQDWPHKLYLNRASPLGTSCLPLVACT